MKLLIQADDYGITRAVSSGIVFGIHHGLVRNTGIYKYGLDRRMFRYD